MSSRVPVSVLVPIKNEAENLPRCLKSVAWADEIIVVDSQSTDASGVIAHEHGARVVQFEFSGTWPKKKNWALENVPFKHEWVFILDADEVLPPEAGEEIARAIAGANGVAGYWINRRFFFLGRWLRHAYYPNWNLRLFKHSLGRYEQLTDADTQSGDNEVHEHVIVQGPTARLRCEMDHYAFPTIDVFIEKHNRYSNWEARVAVDKRLPASSGGLSHKRVERRRRLKLLSQRLPFRPLLRFLYVYVWQRGFLDGRDGYYFARLHATYEFLSVAKTYEQRRRSRKTPGNDSMRVIVWGINYAPEVTGIAPHNVALCEYLEHHGHDVEMVTTFAYYPAWRKRPEDESLLYRTDRIAGVRVHRCWHFVPHRVTAWKRIIHEATFVLTSTARVLFLARPDVYVVPSPPLVLGTAARFVSMVKGAPFIFHVQDLQPDAAVGLGMLKSGWFTRALYWLEAFAYKHAIRVSGISEEILAAFRRKGVLEDKLILYPNSVAIPAEVDLPPLGEFRRKHGFSAGEFLGIYAGNLGVKQGLDILLDAAELLRQEPTIRIVLCGDGAERLALEEAVRARGLQNVSMLPLQFGRDYQELLVDADVSFITQQSGSGNAFFPSKILVTLAHLSPVVTVADEGSALEEAVRMGQFGVNVPPGQPKQLAEALRGLAQNRAQLKEWGRAGRVYVEQFERKRVQESFVTKLRELLTTSQ